jgi:hypothetical protein
MKKRGRHLICPCPLPLLLQVLLLLLLPLLLLPPTTLVCTNPCACSNPLVPVHTPRTPPPSFAFAFAPPARLRLHSPAIVCVSGCSCGYRCCSPTHHLSFTVAAATVAAVAGAAPAAAADAIAAAAAARCHLHPSAVFVLTPNPSFVARCLLFMSACSSCSRASPTLPSPLFVSVSDTLLVYI